MTSSLPIGFVERIKTLKSIVDEVYPKSLADWVAGFELDSNPEKELLIWECIAITYNVFVENRTLTLPEKEEAIQVSLLCSLGVTEEEAQSKRKVLTCSQIQNLFTAYRASAEATLAVHRGRQSA